MKLLTWTRVISLAFYFFLRRTLLRSVSSTVIGKGMSQAVLCCLFLSPLFDFSLNKKFLIQILISKKLGPIEVVRRWRSVLSFRECVMFTLRFVERILFNMYEHEPKKKVLMWESILKTTLHCVLVSRQVHKLSGAFPERPVPIRALLKGPFVCRVREAINTLVPGPFH